MRPSTLRSKATAEDGWRSLRETPLFELNGYAKLARCQKSSSRRKEAHFFRDRRESKQRGKEDKPLPCRSPFALLDFHPDNRASLRPPSAVLRRTGRLLQQKALFERARSRVERSELRVEKTTREIEPIPHDEPGSTPIRPKYLFTASFREGTARFL